MKEINLATFSLKYDKQATERCSVKLDEHTYIEDKQLPSYLFGESTLSFFDFYQADCSGFVESDYTLSEKFQQIISRFPHTNQQKILLTDDNSYSIKNVPVYITVTDYILASNSPEAYPEFKEKLETIHSLKPVNDDEQIFVSSYKRKRLFLDGTYGARELLENSQEKNGKAIQSQLEYVNEMYYFSHYSYAAMVQFLPEYEITTYDQFHEAYGKYIYSVTITKNGKTVPLLWPDYLYHKPENHLEFGLLANSNQLRYQLFDKWEKEEEVSLDILAEGFEDVHFRTRLKQPMRFSPHLSKSDYILGETISLSIDNGLVKELEQQTARFELVKSKKISENGYSLDFELLEEELLLSGAQFEKAGRYQLKIISETYGQLLFLFTLKQEGSIQK